MQIKSLVLALSAVAALSASAAQAANLVTNGDFESTTSGPGQLGYNTDLTGWTSNGYNFVFGATGADSAGVTSQYGNLQLWGPNNGAANGLTSSPAGGNFVAADGAFEVAPLQQTINGLQIGKQYNVSFYWAGAQQKNFDGPNTEQWQVSLGNQTQSTGVYSNPSHGFSGWTKQTFSFTATSASEVLGFMAVGTPAGVPPFSLLDGVSMVAAVPEPATWGMLLGGLGLIGFAARRRFSTSA